MTADKAIASLVMSILTVLATVFGFHIDLTQWGTIIPILTAALAPLVVYLVPNKPLPAK